MTTTEQSAPARARRPRRAARAKLGSLAFWSLFAVALVALWPPAFGGPMGYVVVSGNSMLPTYSPGDLIALRSVDDATAGEVIVFTVPDGAPAEGTIVIHRIVSGDKSDGWVTRGDNNPGVDPWSPRAADMKGRVVGHVPRVGSFLMALHTPGGAVSALALVGAVLIWPSKDKDKPAGKSGPAPAEPKSADA